MGFNETLFNTNYFLATIIVVLEKDGDILSQILSINLNPKKGVLLLTH